MSASPIPVRSVRSGRSCTPLQPGVADIKAIETIYNGYRFRSRLEARWAVFLDEIKVKYEYELEGYEVGEGIRYLPDFFLPDLGVHVEVKPNTDFLTDRISVQKLVLFAVDGDMPLLVVIGSPGNELMALLCRQTMEGWNSLQHEQGPLLQALMMEWLKLGAVHFGTVPLTVGVRLIYQDEFRAQWILQPALLKARQARFEHGQMPRSKP